MSVSSFSVENPRGFGLLQRGRDFSQYEDLDDRYDKRPSAWIEPKGDWGKGTVDLVEIPTADETNDNIVAFWKPDTLPAPGEQMNFDYRLHWTMQENSIHSPDLGWVKQTQRSIGDVRQSNLVRQPDGSLAFLVDFVGPVLAALPEDKTIRSQVTTDDNVELVENNLRYNPVTKGYRLTLRVKVKDAGRPTELTCCAKSLPNRARNLHCWWLIKLTTRKPLPRKPPSRRRSRKLLPRRLPARSPLTTR